VVSQADGEGLVILPSDLSARCTAEALLFMRPFRDQASSEESAPYLALAQMQLRERVKMIGLWDETIAPSDLPMVRPGGRTP
jgi:hypothetical protein